VTRIAALLVLTLAVPCLGSQTPTVAQDGCTAFGAVTVSTAPLAADQLGRDLLLVPGTVARPGVAAPTRAPWVNTNGARFIRTPAAKFRYELPEGKGALAAAEAIAYSGDAVLQIAPADFQAVCRVFAFAKDLPPAQLPMVADIGVIDDGAPALGEVLNLFVRRNLLFQIGSAPQKQLAVNVKIGSPEYPAAEAADPSAFALKIRRQLTDERRGLRIFGSEVVIGRLTGDGTRARLHLVNYGNREIAGLRVRVRGTYRSGDAYVVDQGRAALTDLVGDGNATEFSIPLIRTYAVVDLR
jgi:hypothetical protein